MEHEHSLKIFSCRNSLYLAEKIAKHMGVSLGKSSVVPFKDGEFQPSFNESVRGATVFIVQSTVPPSDNLMELLLMIDAARRASAYKVIAVIPYFGWARQDRKVKPRESIAAKLVANLLQASGCDRVMTVDLHAGQIQGFFDIPVDHIYGSSLFIKYIEDLRLPKLSIASPDIGGAKRAESFAKHLGCPLIICHKSRTKANQVESMTAIGDVANRDVVIVDDMVDTAGTITRCAKLLKNLGAASVRVVCTHPVLSGEAYSAIAASSIDEIIVSDTIQLKDDPAIDVSKFRIVSVAELYADIIKKVYNCESISEEYVY